MTWSTIFRYVFAARSGYGMAVPVLGWYRRQMGDLWRVWVIAAFGTIAFTEAHLEGVSDRGGLLIPLAAACAVVFVLATALMAIGVIAPVRRFLRRSGVL